jgi:cyclophilin family peptidyl-prolyl cis-trans isomerase
MSKMPMIRPLSKPIALATALFLSASALQAQKPTEGIPLPRVLLQTSMGDITLELDSVNAPVTVANFLKLVGDGFYEEIVFHRVVRRAVVQAGIMDGEGNLKGMDFEPIPNEADNHLHNGTKTVAMARGEDPQSATTEFFFNVKDNWNYNFEGYGRDDHGYAVFGEVVEGWDIVERISRFDTKRLGPFRTFPKTMVMIYAAYILN